MGGLLYKDFLAIRGKKLLLSVTIFFILYIGLRILFPGNSSAHIGSMRSMS